MHLYSIGVRQVQQAQSSTVQTANKLSSGNRIHKLGTDSAGLSVSSKQKSDVRSLQMASRNIQDGMTLVDTMSSTLSSMKDLLVRSRELAVQSGNDTYNIEERRQMNAEFTNLLAEFETQAQRSSWNDISVLNSSNTSFTLQIGKDNSKSSKLTLDLSQFGSVLSDITTTSGTLDTTKTTGITTRANAVSALIDLDQALESTYEKLASLGSIQNRLEHALDNNYSKSNSATISAGRISDADYAIETAEMTKNQILLQSGTSAMNKVKEIASASLSLLSS
jgi:flagellin